MSTPVVPLAPALMRRAALDYVQLGSFPAEVPPRTLLTNRIEKAAEGLDYHSGRAIRPGTDDCSAEILRRLSHGGAFASLMRYISEQRFVGRRPINFTVLRAFWPSPIMNYNLDGLATDASGAHHRIVDVHGSIEGEYGGPSGAAIMRIAQEYGIEISREDLVLCNPESDTDDRLCRKLKVMQRCNPAFVMIVGYSFAKNETGHDDQVSLETFVSKFQGFPLDVYVLDPRPFDLAGTLRDRLRTKRVYAVPVYWNFVAAAFLEVLSGRLGIECLEYFYHLLLDSHGPNVVLPLRLRAGPDKPRN